MIDIPDSFFEKDQDGDFLCPKCRQKTVKCDCPSYDLPQPKMPVYHPVIRLEKKGRQGKSVTVIDRLPTDNGHLQEMIKKLKVSIGTGGTFYVQEDCGIIELQGNHIEKVKMFFMKQGLFKQPLNGKK